VNAARPLHLTQQTNAEASPNVCVGPQADVGGVQRSVRMRPECPGVPDSSSFRTGLPAY